MSPDCIETLKSTTVDVDVNVLVIELNGFLRTLCCWSEKVDCCQLHRSSDLTASRLEWVLCPKHTDWTMPKSKQAGVVDVQTNGMDSQAMLEQCQLWHLHCFQW